MYLLKTQFILNLILIEITRITYDSIYSFNNCVIIFFFDYIYNFFSNINSLLLILILSYIILYNYIIISKFINTYIYYCQLLVVNNIYNYIYYLRLIADSNKYRLIYVTLTNLNLKNFFIISGICLYVLYSINLINLIILINQNLNLLKLKVIFSEIFYINLNFTNTLKLQTIIIFSILATITLHAIIGLYMLFFDYLKFSAFILWTLTVYIIMVFLIIFLINTNV